MQYVTPGDANIGVAMAKWLKKNVDGLEIIALTFRNYPEKLKLQDKGENIYSNIISEDDIINDEVRLEQEYIQKIQSTYLNQYSINKVVYHDRYLMYERNGTIYDRFFDGTDEQRYQRVANRFKSIDEYIDDNQPDALLYAGKDTGTSTAMVAYYVAKQKGLDIVVPQDTYYKDYYMLSDTIYSPKDLGKTFTCNKHSAESTGEYRKRKNDKRFTKAIKDKISRELRRSRASGYYKKSRLKIMYDKLKKKVNASTRKKYFDYDDIRQVPSNAVYLPLHVEPERSLSLYAPDFANQIFIAEIVSKNVKYPTEVIVKEHPVMGYRDMEFYAKLSNIPGVKLAYEKIDSEKIIQKTSATITITGTSALEAALLSRPSAIFGDLYYSKYFPSVQTIDCIEDLKDFVGNINDSSPNKSHIQRFKTILKKKCIEFDINYISNRYSTEEILSLKQFDCFMENILFYLTE